MGIISRRNYGRSYSDVKKGRDPDVHRWVVVIDPEDDMFKSEDVIETARVLRQVGYPISGILYAVASLIFTHGLDDDCYAFLQERGAGSDSVAEWLYQYMDLTSIEEHLEEMEEGRWNSFEYSLIQGYEICFVKLFQALWPRLCPFIHQIQDSDLEFWDIEMPQGYGGDCLPFEGHHYADGVVIRLVFGTRNRRHAV